jgi:hypothetical protein
MYHLAIRHPRYSPGTAAHDPRSHRYRKERRARRPHRLYEPPTNHAVNFLTGAGGFLQQVIFGCTGLRLRNGLLEPQFPSILPSHIRRLVLHNLQVRGKRYDVIVDSAGPRMVPHEGSTVR